MSNLFDIFKKDKNLRKLIINLEDAKIIKKNWKHIFGKLSTDLNFGYLKDKELGINVTNYLWKTEIEYYKSDILSKINAYFKYKKVKFLKITYAPLTKKDKVKLSKNKYLNLNLNQKIKQNTQTKIKMGYNWCKGCNEILVIEDLCVFCKSKLDKSKRVNFKELANDNSH